MKIIVIGAGILGASTAYHLSKTGVEVVVIDRNDVGQATDAAAGIICPWISQRRNQAWYELAKRGARFYPSFIQQLEREGQRDTGYARVGLLSVRKEMAQLKKIEQRALTRKEDAPEMGELAILSSEETNRLYPPLDADFASVQVTGAARIDGRALRNALISVAKKNAATFIEGDAALQRDGDRITGAKVNGQSIEADQVIVCAGAWARSLFSQIDVDFNVQFQKAQIIHLQMPQSGANRWPLIMPPGTSYLLSFENDRIVVGTTHEDTDQFDARPTAGGMREVLNEALEVAPGLASAQYVETRVGFRPYTPNFLPVIGRLPGWRGILVANGLGSSGLTIGPYVGYELARITLDLNPDLDLNLYDVKEALE